MLNDALDWLGSGKDRDTVLYTRLRLIRNTHRALFPSKASASELVTLREEFLSTIASMGPAVDIYRFETLDTLMAQVLRERGWYGGGDPFDPTKACAYDKRGILYNINDRDHLRVTAFSCGSDLQPAMELLKSIDMTLDTILEWACIPQLGFLSSQGQDVGSALKLSALVFIPGIVEAKMFERVSQELLRGGIEPHFMEFTEVDSSHGEAISPFVELQYRCPLGDTEEDCIEGFRASLDHLVEGEHRTRERIYRARKWEIEDAAYRAAALLGSCRLLPEEEGRLLLAKLRTGLVYGSAPEGRSQDDQGEDDSYTPLDRMLLSIGPAQVRYLNPIGQQEDVDDNLDRWRAMLAHLFLPQYHIDGGNGCSKV